VRFCVFAFLRFCVFAFLQLSNIVCFVCRTTLMVLCLFFNTKTIEQIRMSRVCQLAILRALDRGACDQHGAPYSAGRCVFDAKPWLRRYLWRHGTSMLLRA
jgi:hypothetical protein